MDAPAVAGSADGKTAVVAWMDMRTGDRDVFWRVFDREKPAQETALGRETRGSQGHASLAIDASGTVHAAWASEGRIAATTSASGGERIVSAPQDDEAGYPCVVAGREPLVVYECRRDGQPVVVCRRLPAAAAEGGR